MANANPIILKKKIQKLFKKISRRFFDFLMLFFAVFLGFMAENYRENRQSEHEANEFLAQLNLDLELDKTNSEKVIVDWNERLVYFDSAANDFTKYINGNYSSLENIKEVYSSCDDFYPTISAYEQLKEKGFRYINNVNLIDSIQGYYNHMEDLILEHQNTYMKYIKMWDASTNLFNSYKLDSLTSTGKFSTKDFPTRSLLLPNSETNIPLYYSKMRASRWGLMSNKYFLERQIRKGDNLRVMIKEYLDKK